MSRQYVIHPKATGNDTVPGPRQAASPTVAQIRQDPDLRLRRAEHLGHRLLGRQLGHEAVQAKLTLGPVGDRYEQEADAVARQVVRQISSRTEEPTEARHEPDAATLRRKSRAGAQGGPIGTDIEASILRGRSGGKALDQGVRTSMESAFGADFSAVKVHTDQQADSLNRSLQARAFTTGRDIFFRQGEYQPGGTGGQELLAHELTHVVQQNGLG